MAMKRLFRENKQLSWIRSVTDREIIMRFLTRIYLCGEYINKKANRYGISKRHLVLLKSHGLIDCHKPPTCLVRPTELLMSAKENAFDPWLDDVQILEERPRNPVVAGFLLQTLKEKS